MRRLPKGWKLIRLRDNIADMKTYRVYSENRRSKPVTLQQIRQKLESGDIRPQDMAKEEGTTFGCPSRHFCVIQQDPFEIAESPYQRRHRLMNFPSMMTSPNTLSPKSHHHLPLRESRCEAERHLLQHLAPVPSVRNKFNHKRKNAGIATKYSTRPCCGRPATIIQALNA